MQERVLSMTGGPIGKQLFLFTLPILAGNFLQQLYNTVDSLIVGNCLGSNALAAVTSSGSLIMLMIGFMIGLSTGAGVVVSRYFGAGDTERLQLSIHTTMALGLVLGTFMTLLGIFLTPKILIWMGTPFDVMPESVIYLRYYFLGSVPFVFYNMAVAIFRALGDSRTPLWYLAFSSIINLILDFFFINFLHTGVGGAATATVLSQCLSSLLCLFRLCRMNSACQLHLSKLRFTYFILRDILRIGLPSGIQVSTISIANVTVQAYTNSFGALAMAGLGAYSKLEGFGFMPINSFMVAITTFVSQNLGAGELERTRKGALIGTLGSMLVSESVGILMYIFAPQLIGLFDSDPTVIAFGVDKIQTVSIFYCVLALSQSMAAILRGAGTALIPMIVMISTWCGGRILFLRVAIPISHSIQILYWAYPITWFMSAGILLVYLRHTDWLHLPK